MKTANILLLLFRIAYFELTKDDNNKIVVNCKTDSGSCDNSMTAPFGQKSPVDGNPSNMINLSPEVNRERTEVGIPSLNLKKFTPSGEALRDGGKGESVVKEVIGYVEATLGDTKEFMKKIALVESHFGDDKGTYRRGYNGGIFQVDKVGFLTTRDTRSHPRLKAKFKKIKASLAIDWMDVSWSDLRKPLYSAIAARLFLLNIPDPIPSDLLGQAKFWKKYYNSSKGAGTVEDFIKRWNDYIHG